MYDECTWIAQESCQIENKLFINISRGKLNKTFIFPNVQTFFYKHCFQDKNWKDCLKKHKELFMSHKNRNVSFSCSVYVLTTMSSNSYFSHFFPTCELSILNLIIFFSSCKNYFQMSCGLNCLFKLCCRICIFWS